MDRVQSHINVVIRTFTGESVAFVTGKAGAVVAAHSVGAVGKDITGSVFALILI